MGVLALAYRRKMCFVFDVMPSQCGSQSVSYFRVLHDVANVCGKFNRTPIRTGRGIGSIHRLQTGLCCTHLRVLSYDNITEIKTGLRRDGTCKYILWIVGINYHGVMNAKHMQLSPSSGCTVEYLVWRQVDVRNQTDGDTISILQPCCMLHICFIE